MILPLGKTLQKLVILTNASTGIQRKELLPVAFVPMTGEAQTQLVGSVRFQDIRSKRKEVWQCIG